MASPPTIRDARPGDLEAIITFNLGLAHETEDKTLDRAVLARGVALALDEPDRLRYWIAEDEAGQVIGQAAVSREWSDWRGGWIWWFQSVYVRREDRGQGVFRALHTRIRELARSEPDVIGLRLYVEQANDEARRVYRSLGMIPGGYEVFEDLWLAGAGRA